MHLPVWRYGMMISATVVNNNLSKFCILYIPFEHFSFFWNEGGLHDNSFISYDNCHKSPLFYKCNGPECFHSACHGWPALGAAPTQGYNSNLPRWFRGALHNYAGLGIPSLMARMFCVKCHAEKLGFLIFFLSREKEDWKYTFSNYT